MEVQIIQNDGHYQAIMKGPFVFSDNHQFREIIDLLGKETHSLTLNLKEVTFVDSAALGMLLLLRDQANQKSVEVKLAHMRGQVKKLLAVSHFDQMFSVVD